MYAGREDWFTLAPVAVPWIEQNLAVPDGPRFGYPLRLSRRQMRNVAESFLFELQPDGTFLRVRRRVMIVEGKGSGKALGLSTVLPSPDGDKTMGTVEVGDRLYGQHGQPVRVLKVHDVQLGRPCFRVEFSNGATVIADQEHEWIVDQISTDRKFSRVRRVVTTGDMAAAGVASQTTQGDNVARFRLPPCPPLAGDERYDDIGIDPWLLGYWLGDGDSASARLTVGHRDLAWVESQLDELGIVWTRQNTDKRTSERLGISDERRTIRALRALGVCGDKHVPNAVLHASPMVRLAVLQGIMDSDGTVCKKGRCELDFCNERLAQSSATLLRSLGVSVIVRRRPASFDRTRWRMSFTAGSDELPLFRMPRKLARQRRSVSWSDKPRVTAVEPAGSWAVRCITVEGGVFLCTSRNIVTHNSPWSAAVLAFSVRGPSIPYDLDEASGRLVSREDPAALGAIFANSQLQGERTIWRPLRSMLKNGRLKDDRRLWVGDTMIKYEDRLITYDPLTPDSAEGPRSLCAVIEESQYMTSKSQLEAIDIVIRNTGKPDGVVLFPTNAPEAGAGSYAEQTIREADTEAPDNLHLHYPRVAEPCEEPEDPDNKPRVMDEIRTVFGSEALDPKTGWLNAEKTYRDFRASKAGRRMYLNRMTAAAGRLVPADVLHAWSLPGQRIPDGQFVVLGFDGSESEDATALVAVSCTAVPHVETLGVWRATAAERKEGWTIPKLEVAAAFARARERFKVEAVIGDPSSFWKSWFEVELAEDWGSLPWRLVGDRSTPDGFGLVASIWWNNAPAKAESVLSHFIGLLAKADEDPASVGFTHDDADALTSHLLSMVKTKNRGYDSVDKQSDAFEHQIDAGIATMLALWGARQFAVSPDDPEVPKGPPTPAGDAPTAHDPLRARLLGQGGNRPASSVQNRLRGR